MEKVCIYVGEGASLARDVEVALYNLGIAYGEIDEASLKKGTLKNCSVLIIPGGYTKLCVDALSKKGFRCIQEFIRDGGGYIGICMGAYIAARVGETPGHPSGLGIINVQNKRKRGMGIKKITVAKLKHPLVAGYKNDIKIWYQNGPMIQPGEEVIGAVLRTKRGVKPIFVSPGNKIDLDTSIKIVLKCIEKHKLPEPVREAHIFVNKIKRELMSEVNITFDYKGKAIRS